MNNPHNILITKEEVENMLNIYGPIGGEPGSETRTRLTIKDLHWYQTAFVHESYHQACQNYTTNPDNSPIYLNYLSSQSNERLEYVGDRVLKSILGVYVEERFGESEREGFLTRINIKIEKCSMLHQIAVTLGFKKFLLLSLQIENSSLLDIYRGRSTKAFYEDAFEAFIGAIRKDHGELGNIYAERFVRNIIENVIDFSELISVNQNFKDSLQRFFQTLKFNVPVYKTILEEGPLYRKVFTRMLYINFEQLSELNKSQQEIIKIYTNDCLKHYQINHPNVYLDLFKNVSESKYILCIGQGKKVTEAEQKCAEIGLLNLNLPQDY
jgi:dsRNA-specific ribonuclease